MRKAQWYLVVREKGRGDGAEFVVRRWIASATENLVESEVPSSPVDQHIQSMALLSCQRLSEGLHLVGPGFTFHITLLWAAQTIMLLW